MIRAHTKSSQSKAFEPKSKFGLVGVGVMVGFHVLLAYALYTGLAGKVLEVIKKPVEVVLIEEVKPPPPEPPKVIAKQPVLPKSEVPPPPAPAPPPPAYVPPPEVTPPVTAAPPVALSPSPRVVPTPTSTHTAPSTPTQVTTEPAKASAPTIAVACPKQVKPVIPSKALEESISGVVKAQARISGTKVVEVQILSGPKVYHAAVRAAMLRYECVDSGQGDVLVPQDFVFSIE